MAAMVGFRISVCDDRQEFANRERFPEAHQIRILENFAQAFAGLAIGREDFVIILTRGHLHDKTVLAQALRTEAGYIGMIGSRKKRDAIYAALLKEGFDPADIDRVHSPIGLAIGAETPEEIAVSILAELIFVRAGPKF
jgi:xanthine dehydrogenase accessory factor